MRFTRLLVCVGMCVVVGVAGWLTWPVGGKSGPLLASTGLESLSPAGPGSLPGLSPSGLLVAANAGVRAQGGAATEPYRATAQPASLQRMLAARARTAARTLGSSRAEAGATAVARTASRSAYRKLSSARAAQVARWAFAEIVAKPQSPLPSLPAGERITGYPAADTARVALADGRHALIASTVPLVTRTSSGARTPVDLSLTSSADAFAPAHPLAAVSIPRRLDRGIALSRSGVTLTPVTDIGTPLEGSDGVSLGASVLYANTQRDADTLIKPQLSGVAADTILRSADSPERLALQVGLPAGAHLVAANDGSERVAVVREGKALALIDRPSAVDAEGARVPVSMSVSGEQLVLSVKHRQGAWRYPIYVDPAVADAAAFSASQGPWLPGTPWPAKPPTSGGWYLSWWHGSEGQGPGLYIEGYGVNVPAGQYAWWEYHTQGSSEIYSFYGVVSGSDRTGGIHTDLYIEQNGTMQADVATSTSMLSGWAAQPCVQAGCAAVDNAPGNTAVWQETSVAADEYVSYGLSAATVWIEQDAGLSGLEADTKDASFQGHSNAFTASSGWINGNGIVPFNAFDPGIGIYAWTFSSPGHPEWSGRASYTANQAGQCQQVQCPEAWTYGAVVGNLPEGIDTVETSAENATGASRSASAQIKVDSTAPAITLSGSLNAANGSTIGPRSYGLHAEIQDGSSVTSSGISSAYISVDGQTVWSTPTTCTPGPCAASGSYTFNAADFGEGTHVITVSATDYAANTASKQITVKVHNSTSAGVGPGTVNLATGELALSATDANVAAPAGALTVARGYASDHIANSSPLGPQWQLAIPNVPFRSLTSTYGGLMLVGIDGAGRATYYYSTGGGKYLSPQGATSVELKVSGTVATLTDTSGGVTTYTETVAGQYTLSGAASAGGIGVATYKFETVGGVLRPSQMLATPPAGVSCSPTLQKGCRALAFVYATSTTATGSGPSEWGDYNSRLKQVTFTGWDPGAGAITTTPVTQYQYDSSGRLRAAWDPRVSPALKRTYGYDAAGHVTALSPAGQQPWLIAYAPAATDTATGRLATISRPAAATALGSGIAPQSTAAPTLSTTSPSEGTSLSVANGSWSNSPLTYSYQWQDCSPAGTNCSAIAGATNKSYTPVESDTGYTLVAQVTATNAGGSLTAASAASETVWAPAPSHEGATGSAGSGNGQFKAPISVAASASGETWITDSQNNRVERLNASGGFVAAYGTLGSGNGQFKAPWGIALNEAAGNIYVTDQGNARIEELTSSGTFVRAFGSAGAGNGQLSSVAGVALDPDGNVWVADYGNNRLQEFSATGVFMRTLGSAGAGNGQFSGPMNIAFVNGKMYVVDYGNNRVQWFSAASGSYLGQFGTTGAGNGQFTHPWGIAVDSVSGDLAVVDRANNRVEGFNQAGTYLGAFSAGLLLEPAGVAFDAHGNAFVLDDGHNQVHDWKFAHPATTQPAPPAPGTTAVWTMSYNVPVSGTGAPYAMGSTDVAAWAQKDLPAEAAAIFPPNKPAANPPADFKGASVYYLDGAGLNVDTAAPGGRISTSEYDANLHAVRTLSAANRQSALEAGAGSAAQSQLLDTQLSYNAAGTELTSELGPRRTVKLANGTQTQARQHVQYSYDEGAPGGATYYLVTKVTSGAQLSEGPDADVHTTVNSYGGQENLGWTLRKPTSVTTDQGGLNIVRTTAYDVATGQAIEMRQPGATIPPPTHSTQFGSAGSGSGQFTNPANVALDSAGNVWAVDQGNKRVEKFSPSGTLLGTYGVGIFSNPSGIAINQSSGFVYVTDQTAGYVWVLSSTGSLVTFFTSGGLSAPTGIAVDSSANLWVADTGHNRIVELSSAGSLLRTFGSLGSGNGLLNSPRNIAIAAGNLYVTDYGNNRVEEFSTTGSYLGQFGTVGAGNGQFKGPVGIAYDNVGGNFYVTDSLNSRVQEFTRAGAFQATFGSAGAGSEQFSKPAGVAVAADQTIFVVDAGNSRIEVWHVSAGDAHDTRTTLYTTAANAKLPACGEHPEWAGLACQSGPLAQPGTAGLPNLPTVSASSYNLWDETLVSSQTSGSTTRTTSSVYDAAGRTTSNWISSPIGTALPTVVDEYDAATGALVKQSTTAGSTTLRLTSVFNTLGEITSYTDADGNVSTFTYDLEGRPQAVYDGKGTQTYGYDATTGDLTTLKDSAAGTFTASYNPGGALLSEGYPNGMSANYTYDAAGQAVGLAYVKTTNCSTNCTWFSDSVVPSIRGQWRSQTSSLSSQSYSYDNAGRVTQVQDTPVGQGCTTRVYAYDLDSNRVAQTTRAPGVGGACASEGGTSETRGYDAADRLTDEGIGYDAFGNITSLPAADAGGHAITNAYYADGTLASQSQNGEAIGYNLDPAGRERETVSTGTYASTVTSHFVGAGQEPAWTVDTAGNWTRNITAISGLAAIQAGGGATVLQLTNLHGDIVATASLSETAPALLSSAESTEFGVPRGSSPAKYSWLGAGQAPTELPSGVVKLGARTYVPQIGRFEQTDPVPGGSASAYDYSGQDPVNNSDLDGEAYETPFEAIPDPTVAGVAGEVAAQAVAAYEAAQAAAQESAAGESTDAEVVGNGGGAGLRAVASSVDCWQNNNVGYVKHHLHFIFDFSFRLHVGWCGGAAQIAYMHESRCISLGSIFWKGHNDSCSISFRNYNTEAVIRGTASFTGDELDFGSSEVWTILCTMRITGSGYSRGGCRVLKREYEG